MAASEPIRRRSLLATRPNPRQGLDYVVRLAARQGAAAARIEIWYVPDRLVLDPAALPAYTARLDGLAPAPLEELAVTVLEDVSDELVPRWARVVVTREDPSGGAGAHAVILEDRQPHWGNDGLLASLRVV